MATINSVSSSINLTSVQMEEYLSRLSWEKMVELSPSVAFLSVLILLGVPGNTLIFFIFWRYFKASSTRVFVLSMAVLDLLTSVLSCSGVIIQICFLYTFIHPDACQAVFIIARLPVVTSGWLLVAVALDRRQRICQPFKRHLSPRQALYLVLVSLALASAVTFPFVSLRNIVKVKTGKDHVYGTRCDRNVEFSSPQLRTAERLTVMLTLIFGSLLMILSYVNIGYQLHRKKSRNHISPHTERQDQKTEEKESHVPIKNSKKDNPTVKSTMASESQVEAPCTPETLETTVMSPTVKKTALSTQDSCTPTVSVRRREEKTTKVSTRGHVGKRIPSRTTLMMFVVTVTAIVNYVPYVIILSITEYGWDYCLKKKSRWEMNSCVIILLFVNINSIVNPFIYSFINPAVRVKCRQFFFSVRQ